MNIVNIPLVALFSLAYGLGHPSLAPYRPASVDKTLSSFHNDLNRTARDFQESAKQLMATRGVLAASAAGIVPENKTETPKPLKQAEVRVAAQKMPQERSKLETLPRAEKVSGFSELKAR